MNREKVEGSSNIDEMGYDLMGQTLEIKFHNGGVYQYSPISLPEWTALQNAPSKGKHFAQHIRNAEGVNFRKV